MSEDTFKLLATLALAVGAWWWVSYVAPLLSGFVGLLAMIASGQAIHGYVSDWRRKKGR